jgi:hypothetical protein
MYPARFHLLSRAMVDWRLADPPPAAEPTATGASHTIHCHRGFRGGGGGCKIKLPARQRPEIETLEALVPTPKGKTERQPNPHPPRSLARATWAIAPLGGRNCYYKPPDRLRSGGVRSSSTRSIEAGYLGLYGNEDVRIP